MQQHQKYKKYRPHISSSLIDSTYYRYISYYNLIFLMKEDLPFFSILIQLTILGFAEYIFNNSVFLIYGDIFIRLSNFILLTTYPIIISIYLILRGEFRGDRLFKVIYLLLLMSYAIFLMSLLSKALYTTISIVLDNIFNILYMSIIVGAIYRLFIQIPNYKAGKR